VREVCSGDRDLGVFSLYLLLKARRLDEITKECRSNSGPKINPQDTAT
jgi:hypothetical protein